MGRTAHFAVAEAHLSGWYRDPYLEAPRRRSFFEMRRKFFIHYESYKEVLVDIRPNGVGRLTRVVICGLLAATAFPASALADGLIGGTPVTVPSVPAVPTVTVPSVSVPAVSVPQVSVPQVSVPQVSASTATNASTGVAKVSTPVASSSIRASASAHVTARTASHHSMTRSKRTSIRHASRPTPSAIASGARTLASATAGTAPISGFFSNPCTGDTAFITGKVTIVTDLQPNGGVGVLTSASFNGTTTTGHQLSDSQETHQWTAGPDATTLYLYDYWKVIESGETTNTMTTATGGDDFYLRTFVEVPVGATGPNPASLTTLPFDTVCR